MTKENSVQPKENFRAKIIFQGKSEHSAKVVDISVEGISLFVESANVDLRKKLFQKQCSASVLFATHLKNPKKELSFWATVSYINAINEKGEYRVGFMTYPSDLDKLVLRRYIFHRQTQLVSEIGQDPPKTHGISISI